MIKRVSALLLALTLIFCLSFAQAVTYPEMRGAVNDDAAVLSDATAQDIDTLNGRSDLRFNVVTRHFLGGMDAQEYCDGLFSAWKLGSEDVLLLLVIGEERYAVAMGSTAAKYISTEQLNSIFSAKLRQPFLQNRDYDGAVGAFLLEVASQAARTAGKTFNASGLFGTAQSAPSQSSSSSNGWSSFSNWTGDLWNSFFSDDELNDLTGQNNSQDYEYDSNDSGFSVSRLILILAVLFIIMRSRRKQGKNGLGILGWGTAGMAAREAMKFTRGHHRR